MAESFVFDVADSLLGKLTSYAYEEVSGAYGVHEDFQRIKDTLAIVRGLLLDAEHKNDQRHGLREWLRQIQCICSDAEDVFDGFEFQDKRKQVVEASGSTRTKVRHFFSSSNPLAFRLRMAHRIKEIRNRLDKVAADGTKFGLMRIDVDPGHIVQKRELTHSHVDALDVIGREKDRDEIIKLLMLPHPQGDGDKSLCVIPIVGIGGLGKTTLAKLVFNDERMDQSFKLRMWVCVSDDFDIKKIIIKIINSAFLLSTFTSTPATTVPLAHQENLNNLDIEQLQTRLRHKLSRQKFLLVLDDVWNDDRAKWIELKDLIKVGAAGSKILVTTRSNSISSMMGDVPPYLLKGLSPKDCLSLFVKWAFKEGEETKYPNLVDIGKEIVKKCRGVPLAVKTLGSSLFSKLDLNKWVFVRDSELWNLEQKKDDILPALKLSYDQMPSYLRQCFAYFSLYPKDYSFDSFEIQTLWIALGLVHSHSRNGSEKLEDVAREYMDELHSRSFLHEFEDLGYVCQFKVHDLIHDLALYVGKEEFVALDLHTQNISKQVRHISVVENNPQGHVLFPKSRSVRTLLFPIKGLGLASETLLDIWISRYKYLRYLDLSNSSFDILPNSIAKLEHLRALDLSDNRKIKNIPSSICNLQNLEFLSFSGCTELETLPEGLGNLISLRQLIISTKQSVLPNNEFARMNHLRTLGFDCCHNLKFLFSKDQLPSLETLFVVSCGSLESLPLNIFPKLHTLNISGCRYLNLLLNNESSILTLRLKYIHLEGFYDLLALPRWIEGSANTLETLIIEKFLDLKILPEFLATMSHLKRLYFLQCPLLENILSNLPLTSLEDLRIDGCPGLCRKCKPQSGEYWPIIAHIKSVSVGEPIADEEYEVIDLLQDDEAELEWKRDVQLGKTIKAIQEFVGSAGITMEWEIVGKLASYAYEEASRAYGVYKDLQGFKDTLSIVSGVLLDAECKKDQKHGVREWLRQIQNICYDAEDVLDGFNLQDKRKQVVKASRSTRLKVRHFFSSSNPLVFRFRMARQIKEIRDRMDKVAADGVRFGLANVDPGLVVQQREMTYPHIDASSVIGRENEQDEIFNLLMQPHPHGDGDGDNSLCVIPIVGIGGLGKTTLAKSVFNDKRIHQLFQLKMWVCISDDFNIRKIIINIINSATITSIFTSSSAPSSGPAQLENTNNLDIVQLVSRLRQKLSGQKFLVVLDDVWNDDRAKWLELKDLIKVGAPGSKIMVTTRSNAIASMMGDVPPYILEGLSPKNCLSLFVKWAFKEGEEKKNPNLVAIGKEIVKKCQGVPLAVRTLASSLFSNFDISKWEFVRDSEMWNLEQKKDDILPALKLSYDQMPSYLKQCFAYFSLFPKHHLFDSYAMCSLWVALGLVQSVNGIEKLESIARKYIDELHSRSFIQDLYDSGSFCDFKLHDLIHDLALYVAREDFVTVGSHTQSIPQQVRHLSVVQNEPRGYALFPKSRSVRSILFPTFGLGLGSERVLDTWLSRYKYLRFLDLSDSSFKTMPNSISKLEHLRTLDLSRNLKIRTLPNSICKLLNLQVLLLNGCMELKNLPKGLGKLISLRRMIATTKQSVLPHDEFASLIHLQTLSLHFCDSIKFLFRQILPFVEELYIYSCSCLESLPLHIFPKLQTLCIRNCEKLNLLLNNESPIKTLRMKHLYLVGFPTLVTLPDWIVCAMDTLETLVIIGFPNLNMLPVFLTSMTRLTKLYIIDCPRLLSLPSDMHRLTALEDLRIGDCPELCRKYRPQSSGFWAMIAHVKSISIEEPTGEEA